MNCRGFEGNRVVLCLPLGVDCFRVIIVLARGRDRRLRKMGENVFACSVVD